MSFSDFTVKQLADRFQLEIHESDNMFASVGDEPPRPLVQELLLDNLALAVATEAEKGRSELLIAPVLLEVRDFLEKNVSVFSGVDFAPAPDQGLSGNCDFLMCRSPDQQSIRVPAVVIVEGKENDLEASCGPCAAMMMGALIFNQRQGDTAHSIYGSVTAGTTWRFLRLHGRILAIDEQQYSIKQLPRLMGVLVHCLKG